MCTIMVEGPGYIPPTKLVNKLLSVVVGQGLTSQQDLTFGKFYAYSGIKTMAAQRISQKRKSSKCIGKIYLFVKCFFC